MPSCERTLQLLNSRRSSVERLWLKTIAFLVLVLNEARTVVTIHSHEWSHSLSEYYVLSWHYSRPVSVRLRYEWWWRVWLRSPKMPWYRSRFASCLWLCFLYGWWHSRPLALDLQLLLLLIPVVEVLAPEWRLLLSAAGSDTVFSVRFFTIFCCGSFSSNCLELRSWWWWWWWCRWCRLLLRLCCCDWLISWHSSLFLRLLSISPEFWQ